MQLRSRVNGLLSSAAKIRAIGTVVQGPMRESLGQFGRLVAISCAKSTQPFGTGAAARDAGRNRVAADIYKVYTTPGKAYADIANEKAAKAFWWALQNGKLDKAIGILRRDGNRLRNMPFERFDGGTLHMTKRNSRTGRVPNSQRPLMIVRNPRQLEAYIKKRQANVGFGKSAWSDIARELGSIRGLRETGDITANWITRNGGRGTIQWLGSKEAPLLRLTSRVSYGGRILPERDRQIAVSIARNRLVQSLRAAVRAETRKLRHAA
ncbi:MAG: hypothetical protein V7609_2082 [Verrucomicrobiota bacterium]